jgi:hypothetical protein
VVARGVAQEDEQWDFAACVKAVTAVLHPLAALCTVLQDVMSLASHCMNCDAITVKHYCRNCMVACYCSTDCQQEHWAAGHMADCEDVAARLHGTAGLSPPLPNINPELLMDPSRKGTLYAIKMKYTYIFVHAMFVF